MKAIYLMIAEDALRVSMMPKNRAVTDYVYSDEQRSGAQDALTDLFETLEVNVEQRKADK